MAVAARRSPLALAILALLVEEPMHPYRMQQLIRGRAKDDVINVRQRASLYQTIERLRRDGLIAVAGTARSENRPERTVYRVTDAGRAAAHAWLREMLATPAREFPEFPAALAHVAMLEPAEAAALLQQRQETLAKELDDIEGRLRQYRSVLPRIVMVEDEYRTAALRAEVDWLQSVIDDLRAGRLTWSVDALRDFAARFEPPGEEGR